MDEQIASRFADISKQLDGFEGRLTSHIDSKLSDVEGRLASSIDSKLSDVEGRLASNIDSKLSGIEGRLTAHVDKQLDAAVKELKHQAQLHKEELKDDVKKAAEGYGATLKKIEDELVDLNKKVDNGFHDHALALTDHSRRIIELEKRR